jgi:hypothetical protein
MLRAFGVYRVTCKRIAYSGSALCLGCMGYIGLRVSVHRVVCSIMLKAFGVYRITCKCTS